MYQYPSFTVYNASAGAGKTYTLVKSYLTIMLASTSQDRYKNILAITFTNKAVGEMKERILDRLILFSKEEQLKNPDGMFLEIAETLDITPNELQSRAALTLSSLVHNYAAFEVSTIDKFTHRIIRTFAKDLKLSLNFDVEMDTHFIIQQTVDALIAKIGIDEELTQVLLDFALEKIDDDKSWDIAFDLNKIAKLLLNENHATHLKSLKEKSFSDFNNLKDLLKNRIKTLESSIASRADSLLDLCYSKHLKDDDFSRKTLPNFLKKLRVKDFNITIDSKWIVDIDTTKFYSSKTPESSVEIIAQLRPEIIANIKEIKKEYLELLFSKKFYGNVTPLSVIKQIQQVLDALKIEQNMLLISDFNELISDAIANQPSPFIYERLGEKFKHYFIDEFQDTSTMQWNNIIPLVENTISQENIGEEKGSLTLVGDAKQSIYRWRGGDVKQFIKLYQKEVPFFLDTNQINIKTLPKNFRSYHEIIAFNNAFFSYIASALNHDVYTKLYRDGNNQRYNDKKGGHVNIQFIDSKNKTEDDEIYPEKVLETIRSLSAFDYAEMCVLTRKKDQGIAIANHLTKHQIPIISSETLLLVNSDKISYIIDFLELINTPSNNEVKIKVLRFLLKQQDEKVEAHHFYKTHIACSLETLFLEFLALDLTTFYPLSFYEKIETLLRHSKLLKEPDAYVLCFLDVVFQFTQTQQSDIPNFLRYWEQKREHLSIVSPEGQNAVSIMTIHKAKGLEFPVVIFPYADLDIYKDIDSNNWLPIAKKNYAGFDRAYMPFGKYFESFSQETKKYYAAYRTNLALDHFNLLYVTLTRAIEQLHIISKNETKRNPCSYASLLKGYLENNSTFNVSGNSYSKGDPARISQKHTHPNIPVGLQNMISNAKEEHNLHILTRSGQLWNSLQEKAIRLGNNVHRVLEHVFTDEDTDYAYALFKKNQQDLDHEEELKLKYWVESIVSHPVLNHYFKAGLTVLNEREIVSNSGKIIIPDRLNFDDDKVTIIDYKTGEFDKKHVEQITEYGIVLNQMNFIVKKKILVYINEEVSIKYID